MERKKYDLLLQDNSISKYRGVAHCILKDINNEIAIQFHFTYWTNQNGRSHIPKRMFLNQFLFKDYPGNDVPKTIIDNIVIMVNTESPDYAMTYKISYDSERKSIEGRMLDRPEMAETRIHPEEIEGIKILF